ncbi:MAG: DUF4328 domain-containing protein [Flavobacteriales bacterium]|nr:DUF4328 domain-containing protein [Flavobacteriales bacterium]
MEQAENHSLEKIELKDNSRRAKLAINVFWAIGILNIIAVISGYFEFELLERIRDDGMYSIEEAESSDIRQGLIGLLQSGLYITSIVVFLNWFRRAYANLHRAGIKNLDHSESMALWSFFIPIISLFRPYKIAREIAVETKSKLTELIPEYKPSLNLSLIGFWWALFIITNYVGQFAFKSAVKSDTVDQMIASSQAYMISDFLDIPAAIVTLLMIKNISQHESLLFENINNPVTVNETELT